uniref:inositol monophosphatase family protein n=1 Tax=Pararhizobium sp. IMCC3301 TaxID=3067904 RepID=UPI0027410B77|nr:inositol monophosphatase [Pararhizobium sp. IMCC3301]
MSDLAERQRVGCEIVKRAAALALDYFQRRDSLDQGSKAAPLDLVTEADRAVEQQIKAELAAAFPDDGFWGEESGGDASQNLWVADPIDGTSNFVAGLPLWGVSLAFVQNGETRIGFLAFPVLDSFYQATKNAGAFRDGQPIAASQISSLDRSRVIFGRSPDMAPDNPLAFATGVLDGGAVIYAFNCCIFNLSQIAEGCCHAYYEERVHPWDYAAGALIVSEAGGRISTDMTAKAYANGAPLFASGPNLWDKIRPFAAL